MATGPFLFSLYVLRCIQGLFIYLDYLMCWYFTPCSGILTSGLFIWLVFYSLLKKIVTWFIYLTDVLYRAQEY